MSSIEQWFMAWLKGPEVANQAARLLIIESFKNDPDIDKKPANLGIFGVFNTLYDNIDAIGEGVDGVKIIGPVQNVSEQPLESQNPMDDQTPPE